MDGQTGKAALALALQRAGRNAAVAAAVAALVPLASVAISSPAEAISTDGTFSVSTSVIPGTSGAPTEYEYTVTNTTEGGLPSGIITSAIGSAIGPELDEIIIPELNSGDFLLGSGTYQPILPSEWSVSQQTLAGLDLGSGVNGPSLKNSSLVNQFIVLSGPSGALAPSGGSATFDLYSNFGNTVAANILAEFTSGPNATFDPNIPNSNPTVPEPASAGLLAAGLVGLAGLATARARKNRKKD